MLSLRFIESLKILEQVGKVSYLLASPPFLEEVHNIFHVSQLKRYFRDDTHKLVYLELEIEIEYALSKSISYCI